MKLSDCKVDMWVYDKRDVNVCLRIIKKNKVSVKVEVVNKHPFTEKTYKTSELKHLVKDE